MPRRSRKRRARNLIAVVVFVAVAAALGVAAWPQAVGLQRADLIANVVSFRGAEIVAALILVLLLVVAGLVAHRERRLFGAFAALLLAFSLGLTALMLVRGVGAPGLPAAGPDDITILSWNTRGDAVPAAEIARVALANGADVVALPGTTEAMANQVATLMRAGGSRMTRFSIALDHVARARSTSLLIRSTLGRYRLTGQYGDTKLVPTVVAVPSGGQNAPEILAVHTIAPRPGDEADWRADLAWVAARCHGRNIVMAGDFNATLDHMAGLATGTGTALGQCRDSAQATGNAAVGSWPTNLPALVGAPIDHVMATANWTASGFQVLQNEDGAGSDHRPVLARLTPSG